MCLAGFGLEKVALMALTSGGGFLVDGVMVMIENIVRHIEAGDAPLEAAYKGARQIGFTIVSLTVSLIAVFIPLLFMRGIVGRLFREFSLTLSVAIVVSAIVSLTLTPMMCARLLRPEREQRSNPLLDPCVRAFAASLALYERSLVWVMRREVATLAVALATLVATIALYLILPKGFLPIQDTGGSVATTDAEPGISFHRMLRLQARAAEIGLGDPDLAGVD